MSTTTGISSSSASAAKTQTPVMQNTYEFFEQMHAAQLISCGFPKPLWKLLWVKLTNQMMDAGNYFQYILDETNQHSIRQGYSVVLQQGVQLHAESNVFLIDHIWTSTQREARSHLESSPELLALLSNLYGVSAGPKRWISQEEIDATKPSEVQEEQLQMLEQQYAAQLPQVNPLTIYRAAGVEMESFSPESPVVLSDVVELELDELNINTLSHFPLDQVFPNLERLSLWGNYFSSVEGLQASLGDKLCQQLKVLWLNDNPVQSSHGYPDSVLDVLPNLEMLDSKFTPMYCCMPNCFNQNLDQNLLTQRSFDRFNAMI